MKLRTGIVLLLAGLPMVATADSDAEMAQCTRVAQTFSSDPRGMSLSDLDALKTCINVQQSAMRGSTDQSRYQVGMERTGLRGSLRDDF